MNLKKLGLTAFVAIISALVTLAAYRYFDTNNQANTFEAKQASAARFEPVSYSGTAEIPSAVATQWRFASTTVRREFDSRT